jgi:acyl dehydratase
MYFEQFAVGQRFTAGPRTVSEADLAMYAELSGDDHPLHTDARYGAETEFGSVIAQGGLGAAVAAGLWVRTGAVSESVVAGLGEEWRWLAPIRPGDALSLTATIVRCEARPDRQAGIITRYNELTNADGVVVQAGQARTLVAASAGTEHDPRADIGTLAWGRLLAPALEADARFRSAVAEWDGTLGVRGGDHEVHLRIYRGRVIEVTRRAPHGATFTFGASDRTWADILTAPEARFGVRLMSGEFEVTGDPYEYLRLTKALSFLVDAVRSVAGLGATSSGSHDHDRAEARA